MKIGFFAVGIGDMTRPDLITAVATHAERLNFSTVWAPEHIAWSPPAGCATTRSGGRMATLRSARFVSGRN